MKSLLPGLVCLVSEILCCDDWLEVGNGFCLECEAPVISESGASSTYACLLMRVLRLLLLSIVP
jgi:hypothetical protein